MSGSDKVFAGSVPRLYESHLVPILFEPYAHDLAARLAALPLERVLEVAAGTGVVTRRLAATLPEQVAIVATDLNQAMLDQAEAAGTRRDVEWRAADAAQLPFEYESFDVVACQFGVMFFPDKARAIAEARRVLHKGGMYLFSVWDRLDQNEFADVVSEALARMFPDNPPRFLARTPYGYHDPATIEKDVLAGGFAAPSIEAVAVQGRAKSARDVAIAFCQGTPLRGEIEALDAARLEEATGAAAEALTARFGTGAIEGKLSALVVTAVK